MPVKPRLTLTQARIFEDLLEVELAVEKSRLSNPNPIIRVKAARRRRTETRIRRMHDMLQQLKKLIDEELRKNAARAVTKMRRQRVKEQASGLRAI